LKLLYILASNNNFLIMFSGALQACNGLYVCAEDKGNGYLIANRPHIGEWETFDFIPLPGGTVALRSHANGKFVCADPTGPQPLRADRMAAKGW
jgi:hypothetical protein